MGSARCLHPGLTNLRGVFHGSEPLSPRCQLLPLTILASDQAYILTSKGKVKWVTRRRWHLHQVCGGAADPAHQARRR